MNFYKIISASKFIAYLSIQYVYNILKFIFLFFTERLEGLLQFVPERYYPKLLYPIEEEIVSASTRVIFTRRKNNRQPICLKLWLPENIRNTKLMIKSVDYLVEGFEFNHHFAPFTYLGIAPVFLKENGDVKKILRGKLIAKPKKQDLKSGVEYASVIRRINENQRLDSQIHLEKLSEKDDLKFLAKEVAHMHKQLAKSPADKGITTSISSKLEINRQFFEECLQHLDENSELLDQYMWICELMAYANLKCTDLFQKRHDDQHIKRCHGDLKTTNLWIKSANSYLFGLIKRPRQLFPIDCIDFNPEFCHIDTLSDIAMLVIDLEMHFLPDCPYVKTDFLKEEHDGISLVKYFLDCYLREMQEDNHKWDTLLEYYMTEKSMVCAYVSILFDKRPPFGKKYLEIAYYHATKLEKILKV